MLRVPSHAARVPQASFHESSGQRMIDSVLIPGSIRPKEYVCGATTQACSAMLWHSAIDRAGAGWLRRPTVCGCGGRMTPLVRLPRTRTAWCAQLT